MVYYTRARMTMQEKVCSRFVERHGSGFIIFCIAFGIILALIYLNLRFPVFFDPDSYYNIAVAGFIKDLGFMDKFRWAQFSVFHDHFADKDLLLHILCLPFLYLMDNPVLAGKYSIILCTILFVLSYLFILRRYLPGVLAGVFLLFPFFSSIFSAYILELRSITLANILTMLGIFFLINRRLLPLFVISVLYPLAHLSFFMIMIFALICETVRYIFQREFFVKNIYIVVIGAIAGCLIHPNFPNNFIPVYLNGMLMPLHIAAGIDLGFSGETKSLGAIAAFVSNFAVFFMLAIILWGLFMHRKKIGFPSAVWFVICGIYLVLSLFSARYWFQVNTIFFISAASYMGDMLKAKGEGILSGIKRLAVICLVAAMPLLFFNMRQLGSFINYFSVVSADYEDIGKWMERNIPRGQTIYHSYWDDASYFICLNPKNNYINMNDPIYMYYLYPKESALLEDLSMWRVDNPHTALSRIFRVKYGYLRKTEPLYRQITGDKLHFKILYENDSGAVFEIQ